MVDNLRASIKSALSERQMTYEIALASPCLRYFEREDCRASRTYSMCSKHEMNAKHAFGYNRKHEMNAKRGCLESFTKSVDNFSWEYLVCIK
jgi:hypothetical protein